MVQQVLVGFDGSGSATVALRWAAGQAELYGVKLVAIASVDERSAALDAGGADAAQAALAHLREAVREASGDSAVFRTGHGHAAAQLVAACTEDDLLVVGSRGRSPVAGMLLGSVSHACLRLAPCPVVIVKAQPQRTAGRVIVGVDGSPSSRRALQRAADEARLRGVVLHAVHAVHWDQHGVELMVPTRQQLIGWGKELLSAELTAAGVTARPVVVEGHAADVLTRHSTHADLLVVGSRGRNPLAGLLLGSTSDHCARHASCPVIVVR